MRRIARLTLVSALVLIPISAPADIFIIESGVIVPKAFFSPSLSFHAVSATTGDTLDAAVLADSYCF